MNDNEDRYCENLKNGDEAFESICSRCGFCCGAVDDPCNKLVRGNDGKFLCSDYSNRLGPQSTISGKFMYCVSIREHIKNGTLPAKCRYHVLC